NRGRINAPNVTQRTEFTGHPPKDPRRLNQSNFLLAEGNAMTPMEHLLSQVTRAERFAKHALDALTVRRLTRFAAECGDEFRGRRGTNVTSDPVGLPTSRNDLCVRGKDR